MLKKRLIVCLSIWLPIAFVSPIHRVAGLHIIKWPAAKTGYRSSFQSAPLIINEYLADPASGASGDANGDGVFSATQDEFVELVNRSAAPLDIGGFSVSDALQVRFTIPPGSIIPPGEAAVIFGGGTPTGSFGSAAANGLVFAIGGSGLSLNNASDSIIIKDAAGLQVIRHDYPPPDSDNNESITRSPDIAGGFVGHSAATGSGGRLFSPGARVDGSPFNPAPHVDRISPDRVPFDSPPFDLAVEGAGFEEGSRVFIDSAAVETSFVNANHLVASVPASVISRPGAHRVEVRNQNGNRSNVVTLTITPPPPVLLSVLPRVVNIGAGSFTLFALGDNFQSSSVIVVEETPLVTVMVRSGELRATVPSSFTATTGVRRVRVRNLDGQQSFDRAFEVVLPSARLTAIRPAEAMAGGPQFTLTVTGANFREGAVILFDQAPLPTRSVSATAIQSDVATSLIATPGLKGVKVQNADGTLSNEVIFRISAIAPVIHSIDPLSVTEGSTDRTITIIGEKFQPGATARLIEPSGPRQLLETVFVSGERLEVAIQAELFEKAGRLLIRVENPDSGVSNNAALNVSIRDPLIINEFLADPADGTAGDANGDGSRNSSQDEFVEIINRTSEQIDLSGYRLSDADSVRHIFAAGTILPPFEATVVFGGGTAAGRFGNAAENNLVFRASSGGLSLNNGGDTIRLEDAEGRLIDEIAFGAAEGGANQSINRDPDIDGALFSRHSVVARRAALFSPGTRVTGEAFTIKPVIRQLSPDSRRRASGAFKLTVAGDNFQPGATLLFDQTVLETVFISEVELETEIDGEAIIQGGAIEVRVRNPKGELSAIAKFVIFDDPPRIDEVTPRTIGTGAEALEIAVAGERFQPGARALVAGEPVETIFIDSGQIRARLPARLFTRASSLEIRLLNADGNLSNALTIDVENGPLITRLSRSKVRAGNRKVDLSIGGVAFKPGVTIIIGDQPVETAFVSESSLTAVIPAGLTSVPGLLTLQALNPDRGRSNKVTIRVIE